MITSDRDGREDIEDGRGLEEIAGYYEMHNLDSRHRLTAAYVVR